MVTCRDNVEMEIRDLWSNDNTGDSVVHTEAINEKRTCRNQTQRQQQ